MRADQLALVEQRCPAGMLHRDWMLWTEEKRGFQRRSNWIAGVSTVCGARDLVE
jgi:hypothetical protein